jgi:hypothetical protein
MGGDRVSIFRLYFFQRPALGQLVDAVMIQNILENVRPRFTFENFIVSAVSGI